MPILITSSLTSIFGLKDNNGNIGSLISTFHPNFRKSSTSRLLECWDRKVLLSGHNGKYEKYGWQHIASRRLVDDLRKLGWNVEIREPMFPLLSFNPNMEVNDEVINIGILACVWAARELNPNSIPGRISDDEQLGGILRLKYTYELWCNEQKKRNQSALAGLISISTNIEGKNINYNILEKIGLLLYPPVIIQDCNLQF